MPKLSKKSYPFVTDGQTDARTDPNYRKASLLKIGKGKWGNVISIMNDFKKRQKNCLTNYEHSNFAVPRFSMGSS